MTAVQAQCLLKYLGYYAGRVDGIWGEESQWAAEAFIRDHNPHQMEAAGMDGLLLDAAYNGDFLQR